MEQQKSRHILKFRQLHGLYAVVRLEAQTAVPEWATRGEFSSITRTAEELSVVCLAENVPSGVHSPHKWTCLKLQGPFPFSMTGVLLSFIEPLSSNGVSIFAISTFDTDYVLVQQEFAGAALKLMQAAEHVLLPEISSQ